MAALLSRGTPITILSSMQENDDTKCVGNCNFVIVRETRPGKDGRPIVEDVERCTRCGYVLSRQLLSASQLKR